MSLTKAFRDGIALKMLGGVLAKTAGELSLPSRLLPIKGWVYVGSEAFLFVVDQPVFNGPGASSDPYQAHFFYQEYNGCSGATLTTPRFVPNGLVDFGSRGRLLGEKKQMKVLFDHVSTAAEA